MCELRTVILILQATFSCLHRAPKESGWSRRDLAVFFFSPMRDKSSQASSIVVIWGDVQVCSTYQQCMLKLSTPLPIGCYRSPTIRPHAVLPSPCLPQDRGVFRTKGLRLTKHYVLSQDVVFQFTPIVGHASALLSTSNHHVREHIGDKRCPPLYSQRIHLNSTQGLTPKHQNDELYKLLEIPTDEIRQPGTVIWKR